MRWVTLHTVVSHLATESLHIFKFYYSHNNQFSRSPYFFFHKTIVHQTTILLFCLQTKWNVLNSVLYMFRLFFHSSKNTLKLNRNVNNTAPINRQTENNDVHLKWARVKCCQFQFLLFLFHFISFYCMCFVSMVDSTHVAVNRLKSFDKRILKFAAKYVQKPNNGGVFFARIVLICRLMKQNVCFRYKCIARTPTGTHCGILSIWLPARSSKRR